MSSVSLSSASSLPSVSFASGGVADRGSTVKSLLPLLPLQITLADRLLTRTPMSVPADLTRANHTRRLSISQCRSTTTTAHRTPTPVATIHMLPLVPVPLEVQPLERTVNTTVATVTSHTMTKTTETDTHRSSKIREDTTLTRAKPARTKTYRAHNSHFRLSSTTTRLSSMTTRMRATLTTRAEMEVWTTPLWSVRTLSR